MGEGFSVYQNCNSRYHFGGYYVASPEEKHLTFTCSGKISTELLKKLNNKSIRPPSKSGDIMERTY